VTLSAQIAKHFRDVYFGGNWTAVNLKETLADVSWQEATIKVDELNMIGVLLFHIDYYVNALIQVLQGKPLTAKDKFSFDLPPIQSTTDWEDMLTKVWQHAEVFAELVEQLPERKLSEPFLDGKYGTWYRNLTGLIEHTHYHLGQIVLVKKLLRQKG
jgi:hypothetical protein